MLNWITWKRTVFDIETVLTQNWIVWNRTVFIFNCVWRKTILILNWVVWIRTVWLTDGWLVGFYAIWTFVGYLTPNVVINMATKMRTIVRKMYIMYMISHLRNIDYYVFVSSFFEEWACGLYSFEQNQRPTNFSWKETQSEVEVVFKRHWENYRP